MTNDVWGHNIFTLFHRIDCGKTKQDTLLSNSLQYKKSITRQEGPVLAR